MKELNKIKKKLLTFNEEQRIKFLEALYKIDKDLERCRILKKSIEKKNK